MSEFYEDILGEMDEDYSKAEGADTLIPVGDYRAIIADAEITVPDSGIHTMVWKLKIQGPKCAGRVLYHRNQLIKDPERLKYVKKDIMTVGVELEKFSDLGKKMDEFKGRVINIRVYHSGGGKYANCYINSLHSKSSVTDQESDAGFGGGQATHDDDDVPF